MLPLFAGKRVPDQSFLADPPARTPASIEAQVRDLEALYPDAIEDA
jgi:hypothetical protein